MDKKDWLNKIVALPNGLNLFLIKINFFPQLFLGKAYRIYRRKLKQQHYLSYDYTTSLINLVNQSIKKIPYYKNYTPINSLADFQQQIGFIDKEVVMANFNDFVDSEIDKTRYVEGTTGGTSGKPLRLLIPKNRHVFELATMHTMWETTGWKYHPRAVIRNHKLKPGESYRINPITKEFIFDGFRTDKVYFLKIYEILKTNNIQYIHAYPSSAYQFANFLKNNKLNIDFLKVFLCGSEGVLPEHFNLIQNNLGKRLYNWYGLSEKNVLGGFCANSNIYHMEPTYSLVELIDEKGFPVKKIGEIGEIVGTSFHNYGMPLIRYRTGDFAEYAGNKCPHCGRNLLLVSKIEGRREINKIYLKDNSYISITALNLHDDLYNYIDGMQYIQNVRGKLEILLIKGKNFNKSIEQRFYNHFTLTLKDKCEFWFTYTDSLIFEDNGKFLALKQDVKV